MRYAQTVATTPIGTETRKTSRQRDRCEHAAEHEAEERAGDRRDRCSRRARGRAGSAGNASVRIALEFANSSAPPTPCPTRIRISQSAPALPCIQVTESRIEKTVKTAKPRLNIRTRP